MSTIEKNQMSGEAQALARKRQKTYLASIPKAWLIFLAAVAMTILEGAFRKWVFPSSGAVMYLLYLSKDIIFAFVLFFPIRKRPTRISGVFEKWLLPGCALIALGAMLSSTQGFNVVGSFLSARALIILPVVAWLAIPRLGGLHLRWVLWLLIALTVGNFALGVVQNHLPADDFLNRYAREDEEVATAASGVRATGTFAYIGGLTCLSSVGIWAGMVLLSVGKSQWERAAGWLGIAAGFGCGLASVSRAPIYVGLAMMAVWVIFSGNGFFVLTRGLAAGLAALVLALALNVLPVFTDLTAGLAERSATAGDTFQDRTLGPFEELFDAVQAAPFGSGFGTEQVAANYYTTGTASFTTYESASPRLVIETGVLGFIGYTVIWIGAILALQAAKTGVVDNSTKLVLLATQTYLVLMFYGGGVIFNHTASAFAWLIFAAVLSASELAPKTKRRSISPRSNKVAVVH